MTEHVPSSSSAAEILQRLKNIRDEAQGLARDSLGVTETADRAAAAVEWGVREGFALEFHPVYARQLDEALGHLQQGRQWVASASSATQFLVAATTTAATSAVITETIFKAPVFAQHAAQEQLDRELAALWGTDELGAERRAAWHELRLGTFASAVRACHSSRRILAHLLDRFAAEGNVQLAPWWTRDDRAPRGVVKAQKIRYFLVGGGTTQLDSGLLAELERLIGTALETHRAVESVAHKRGSAAASLAEKAMVDLEEVTLALLLFRRRLHDG